MASPCLLLYCKSKLLHNTPKTIIRFSLFHYIHYRCTDLNWKRSFPFTTFMIIAYNFLIKCVPRTSGVFVFYATTFVLNLSLVFVLLCVIPTICKNMPDENQSTTIRYSPDPRYEGTTEEDMATHRPVTSTTTVS